jgi:hypothetical protein
LSSREPLIRVTAMSADTKVAQGTFKFVLIGEGNRPRAIAANETLLLPKDNDNGQ